MAIQNIQAYAHLSPEDVEEIGKRFAEIERKHRETLGEKDAAYIRNLIRSQRGLEILSRLALVLVPSLSAPASATLGVAKILENLEIGHNVMHGQWDWMNDPEIHSSSWEWDNTGTSKGWKHSHNFSHHTFTNIIGMDNDIGYGIIRITRDKQWKPTTLAQPVTNIVLAALFEYAVAFYDVELGRLFAGKQSWKETKPALFETLGKIRTQVTKDYIAFPVLGAVAGFLLPGTSNRKESAFNGAKRAAKGALTANLIRNVWAYAVIFCGHFPDDVETFTKRTLGEESKAEWYLRQMLGSANFRGGRMLSILSGNLNYQVEHHLFPDMPSNRLSSIGKDVEKLARDFGLPYNVDSFPRQFFEVQRTILKMALPNSMLRAKTFNAPEVRSDEAFERYPEIAASVGQRQLSKGLKMLKALRPRFLA